MFKSHRTSGLALRLSLLPAAVLALCVAGSAAHAQTAPSLVPYTSKLIAGGGVSIASGATCPTSGYTSTDAYGDGCLATEILLTVPKYAAADKNGNVFFGDYTNGLVRRVDVLTGIVTAVAGGAASSPGAASACGTNVSTDADGDGCLGTAVKLGDPAGIAFSPTGDLYFADNYYDNVRKIAATNGLITTSGVITNVAGGTTYGFAVNNTAGSPVIAATQSYLNYPYGLAFDAAGNLYIGDEGNNAIEVVNLTSASETIQGLVVPAGTISKIAGYGSLPAKSAQSGDCPSFTSTTARGGCYYAATFTGATGVTANIDGNYSVAVDATGKVYFANEYEDNIGLLTTTNALSTYAGISATAGKVLTRGVAGTFAIGSSFGVATDPVNNLYITDASNGVVWRVDSAGKLMYVIAGGATAVCSAATDKYGDGCPATQATFGSSGTTFASTTAPGPGIFGAAVDAYSNLYVGDTETGLIREIASGTQFGSVGANQPTQNVEIHFAANDTASAYTLTSGTGNFTLGTAVCTTNSDATTDCVLPVTATPSTLGAFTGTLQVTSKLGGVASFPLTGTFAISPVSRTVLTVTGGVTCSGTTTYSTSTSLAVAATLVANGPSAPVGMITFSAKITPVSGTATTVTIATLPVTATGNSYGASTNYTPTVLGSYVISAVYSGDTYFKPSTGTTSSFSTSTPGINFATTLAEAPSLPCTTSSSATIAAPCVLAGQTALFALNLTQTSYTGTINFTCSGLPNGASCVFSPASLAATGCSVVCTVAVSIVTAQATPIKAGSFGSLGGGSPWQKLSLFAGLGMALLIGLRRRRVGLRYGQLWMALALLLASSSLLACSSPTTTAATTAGTSTVTVTATGSTGGAVASFPLSLTVYSN